MHMSIEWAPYRMYNVGNVFHLCSTVIIIGIVLVFTVTFLCVSDFLWSWGRLLAAEFEVLLIYLPFMRSGFFFFIYFFWFFANKVSKMVEFHSLFLLLRFIYTVTPFIVKVTW